MATKKVNTDDWKGIRIELYILENQKAFGSMWDVVRVAEKQIAPERPVDYSKQIETLRKCTSLDELRAAYSSLTSAEQAATVSVKDELKTKLLS